MKIEIDFEKGFDSDGILPIPLGRIHIGDHIGRFFFSPKGKTVLCINSKAIKDGSVVLVEDLGEGIGFGKLPESPNSADIPCGPDGHHIEKYGFVHEGGCPNG
jgi:hypothetical protein